MKLILPILLLVIIVLPLILPSQVFAQSPEWEAENLPPSKVERNKIGENDILPLEGKDSIPNNPIPYNGPKNLDTKNRKKCPIIWSYEKTLFVYI